MLQKITELWPGLVKVIGSQDNDEDQSPEPSKDSDSQDDNEHVID